MRRIAVGLVLSCAALAFQPRAEAPAPRPIVLRAARMFDARKAALVTPGLVVVTGKTITAAGAGAAVPPDAEVIDLGDATLLPGFIDAHVHIAFEMGRDVYRLEYDAMRRTNAEQALYAAMYARRTLDAGFTTVRDMGSEGFVALGLRQAINAGVAEGPHVLVSNHAIGSTGGHADGDAYQPGLVRPGTIEDGICNGADACRAAVRYQMKYGADVIKVMFSGGVLSTADPVDTPQFSQEEMNAIVAEAHAWKRKVAGHCHGDRAAKMAIAAGVDSIEHGSFLEADTLQAMKEKGIVLVPTFAAIEGTTSMVDVLPAPVAAKARAAGAAHQRMFTDALRVGVKIALGTDSAVTPHGRNAREFGLMVAAGMKPAAALVAGTLGAAELLGVADRTGTLEAGREADIVAVLGDVLADIHATERVLLVMKDGAVFKRPR